MATQQYAIFVDFTSNVGGTGPLIEGGASLPEGPNAVQKISAMFAGIAGGIIPARVTLVPTNAGTGTAGTETITCTQASVSAGDTVTIGGHVLTAVASGANKFQAEFNIGASDTAVAVNMKETANVHPYINKLVVLSNSVGVITVTQLIETAYALTLAETGTGFVLGGATVSGTQNTVTLQPRSYGGA